jgi:hypothetical protein
LDTNAKNAINQSDVTKNTETPIQIDEHAASEASLMRNGTETNAAASSGAETNEKNDKNTNDENKMNETNDETRENRDRGGGGGGGGGDNEGGRDEEESGNKENTNDADKNSNENGDAADDDDDDGGDEDDEDDSGGDGSGGGGGGGGPGGGGGDDEEEEDKQKKSHANDRLCCSCKKIKGDKKKANKKNRTRIRQLPTTQLKSLKTKQREALCDEFKFEENSSSLLLLHVGPNETKPIDNNNNSDDVKLRLCFECFKKIVKRLKELALESSEETMPMTHQDNEEKEKVSIENASTETKCNEKSSPSSSSNANNNNKVIDFSDDDYYDYDDDDDNDDGLGDNNGNEDDDHGGEKNAKKVGKGKGEKGVKKPSHPQPPPPTSSNDEFEKSLKKVSNDKNNNLLFIDNDKEATTTTTETMPMEKDQEEKESSKLSGKSIVDVVTVANNRLVISDVISDAIKSALHAKTPDVSDLAASSSSATFTSLKDLEELSAKSATMCPSSLTLVAANIVNCIYNESIQGKSNKKSNDTSSSSSSHIKLTALNSEGGATSGEAVKLNINNTITASIASVIEEQLTTNKSRKEAESTPSPSPSDKTLGMNILTDLIKAQLQQSPPSSHGSNVAGGILSKINDSLSKPAMPPPPVPPSSSSPSVTETTPPPPPTTISVGGDAAKKESNDKYTLGKWVDTIIVKMNIPSIEDLEVDDSLRQSNFKDHSSSAFSKNQIRTLQKPDVDSKFNNNNNNKTSGNLSNSSSPTPSSTSSSSSSSSLPGMTSPNSRQSQKHSLTPTATTTTNQQEIIIEDDGEKDERSSRMSPDDNKELIIRKEKNVNSMLDSPSSAKKQKLSNDGKYQPSPPNSHSTSPVNDTYDAASRNRSSSSITRKILEQNPNSNQRVIQQSKSHVFLHFYFRES